MLITDKDRKALSPKRLIVGLGNPGPAYQKTRHNIGYLVIDEFAKRCGLRFSSERRFDGALAKGVHRNKSLFLLKPETYMNESGRSVKKLQKYYDVPTDNILVLSDDISLEFGRMRLRERGSSGGHNGLKSIEASLNSQQFQRLRLGVGFDARQELSDYVLSKFSAAENKDLDAFLLRALDIAERWLDEDYLSLCQDCNGRSKPDSQHKEKNP